MLKKNIKKLFKDSKIKEPERKLKNKILKMKKMKMIIKKIPFLN
jgi:hypothetical protein